jgi:hypothetical protein
MNLNTSLNKWIDHIFILLARNKLDTHYKYKGGALNGFKNSKATSNAAQFIENTLKVTIDVTNMDETLLKLIKMSDPTEFSRSTTNFIRNAISLKSLISKQLNDDQIMELQTQLKSAEEAYEVLEIDETINSAENNVETHTDDNNVYINGIINETIMNEDSAMLNSSQLNNHFQSLKDMLESTLHNFSEQLKSLKQQQSTGYENKSMGEILGLLNFRLNKLLRLQHTVKLQQQYIDTNTIPNALSIDKFFRPMKCTTHLLTKMDEIYNETVKKINNAIIEDTNEAIAKVEMDISKIKISLERFKDKDDVLKLVNEQKDTETKKLKFRFDKALKRGKKNKIISFLNYYKDQIEDDPLVEENESDTTSNNTSDTFTSSKSKQIRNFRRPTSILRNSKQRSRSNSRIRFNNQNINNENRQQQQQKPQQQHKQQQQQQQQQNQHKQQQQQQQQQQQNSYYNHKNNNFQVNRNNNYNNNNNNNYNYKNSNNNNNTTSNNNGNNNYARNSNYNRNQNFRSTNQNQRRQYQ